MIALDTLTVTVGRAIPESTTDPDAPEIQLSDVDWTSLRIDIETVFNFYFPKSQMILWEWKFGDSDAWDGITTEESAVLTIVLPPDPKRTNLTFDSFEIQTTMRKLSKLAINYWQDGIALSIGKTVLCNPNN